MMVRAKFTCVSKKETTWAVTYEFSPVTSGSPENEMFFGTTPAGNLTMTVKNEAVSFEIGRSYYIDFTEVPDGS